MSKSKRTGRLTKVKADDYFNNGVFEMARFGKNILIKNNRTPEQQNIAMKALSDDYADQYKRIASKIESLKEKVLKCDPFGLLMYLRIQTLMSQINIVSEIDHTSESNALVHAQEFIQSLFISSKVDYEPLNSEDEESLYQSIVVEYCSLHKELLFFYHYWAAHVQQIEGIPDKQLRELVEAQYMYWVRGKRYQIFELVPLEVLLPPHNDILNELFGVTAEQIIRGLDKLRYALSQSYADALMDLGNEYDQFCKDIDSGMEPEKARIHAAERSGQTIGKLFGSDLVNVKLVTGWDDRFIKLLSSGVNEQPAFGSGGEFEGWPIVDLPVAKKPFIEIDGTAYSFLYYALFDNIYRNIQKGIMRSKPDYLERWKEAQTVASEEMVRDQFLKLLPGAQAHIGNYYPKSTSKKRLNENDIIITFQNYLFIIEVKAGSYPMTPPITDFKAHMSAYKSLAEVADSQCSRTLEYIRLHPNAQFYDKDGIPTFQLPALDSFDAVFTFSVTVDNFNAFAAKAEKSSIISLQEDTIVISYDDLLVYAEYFTSGITFLHYLKQRKCAIREPKYQMNDEFDHLGLYIDRNMYALDTSQYGDVKEVHWNGFRQALDEYYGCLYIEPKRAIKPKQSLPPTLLEIISYLDRHISEDNIRLAHFLLNYSTEARSEFAKLVNTCIERQKKTGRRSIIRSFGDTNYCAFIFVPEVETLSEQEQSDYTYACASRNKSKPTMRITLEYDVYGKLIYAYGREYDFSDLSGAEYDRIKALGEEKAQEWIQSQQLYKKIGRNDICPCGSGKKYKHCCLKTIIN